MDERTSRALTQKDHTMKNVFKSLIVASMLATAGFVAHAQPSMDGMSHEHSMHGHKRMDPAKIEAKMAKHHAALKAKLKITAEQENAWATFTAALKPTGTTAHKRPDRAEMEKLTTPERIDKMKALRTQHMADMAAAMDKRGEATKVFYATLSDEQKKVFDTETARMGAHHKR
jgi:periplasmic protein CpxP/Spy